MTTHPLVEILQRATQIRNCPLEMLNNNCELCRYWTRVICRDKNEAFETAYSQQYLRPTACCWEITDRGVAFMQQLKGNFA